jgi:cellulose biosynthesis protein BcsQ
LILSKTKKDPQDKISLQIESKASCFQEVSKMAVYALWNNKGGVGKSYLTFQIACEYARTHPSERILVIDMCPQANASSMLLGGMIIGEEALNSLSSGTPRLTIAGYIRERLASPYHTPASGASYLTRIRSRNAYAPSNLFLVTGDEDLEVLASRVSNATQPGPDDAWAKVHLWLQDLINDVRQSWGLQDSTVFIDCNPSFGIYTELALSASDRLIIPFSADGSSKRAVRTVLSLLYGIARRPGAERSEFYRRSEEHRLRVPKIYCYIGNRMTQANLSSAKAFRTVVNEIGSEIWDVWQTNPNAFQIHPAGTPSPTNRRAFRDMFQAEVVDANTASVVSGSLGYPIMEMHAGSVDLAGRSIMVNQSQLDRQQPNMRSLVDMIEGPNTGQAPNSSIALP